MFIVDVGHEIFVWIGKKTTAEEKKSGMTIAASFLEQEGRPATTPVTRILESGETSVFKVSP